MFIIETNLLLDENGIIRDHQSRVIESVSWYSYINEIKNNLSVHKSSFIGYLHGNTIPDNSKVDNLVYDDSHLSCDVTNRFGYKSKKLAYNCDYKCDHKITWERGKRAKIQTLDDAWDAYHL